MREANPVPSEYQETAFPMRPLRPHAFKQNDKTAPLLISHISSAVQMEAVFSYNGHRLESVNV